MPPTTSPTSGDTSTTKVSLAHDATKAQGVYSEKNIAKGTVGSSRDSITILQTRGELLATKKHTRLADGTIQTDPYANSKHHDLTVESVASIFDLAEVLRTGLETKSNRFLIRGVPKRSGGLTRVQRLKAENGGIFEPSEGHHWLPLDLDELASPVTDAVEVSKDGTVVGITDPAGYVRSVITTYLPSYLQDVTCYYQFSSSAGVKPWNEVRLRLFFWLTEPVADSVLHDVWAKHYVACVDRAIYRDVQPIYTAPPVFVGMADPCESWRSGLLRGSKDETTIPPEHLTEPERVKQDRLDNERRLEEQLKNPIDGDSAWRYAVAALEGTASDIAALTDDRYNGVRRQARRLAGYSQGLGARAYEYLTLIQSKLEDASHANGLIDKRDAGTVREAIASAIEDGAAKPIPLPISNDWDGKGRSKKSLHTPLSKRERIARAVNEKAQLDAEDFDQVIDVNTRYLTDEWAWIRSKLPGGPAIVIVQSHIGSAKSTAVFNELASSNDVKFIAPLTELCASIAKKTKSTNYKEFENDNYRYYHLGDSHRTVTTPNSDPKFNFSRDPDYEGNDEPPIYTHKDGVYDEFDAIVGRLSDDDVNNEQSMFDAMVSTIAGALLKGGKVWCLSAYHRKSELILLNYVRTRLKAEHGLDIPLILIRNLHKPKVGHTYEVLEARAAKGTNKQKALRAAIIRKAIELRKAGKCVAIGTDNDAFAKDAHEALNKAFPDDDEPLLLDADHKNEPRQRAFLDDPERDARQFPIIIYSPVLQTGFDIPRDKHDHELLGYFCGRSIDPMQATQLAGRFRGVQHMTLGIGNFSSGKSCDVDVIKAELRESQDADNRLLKTTLDGRRVWANPTFTDIHAHNISHDRWLRSAWRSNFLALLDGQGYEQVDTEPVEVDSAMIDEYDTVKAAVLDAEATEIADAAGIDQTEGDRLKRKIDLTKNEQRQLEAFEYQQFYGVIPTKEDVLEDRRGRLRSIVSRLATARADDTTLLYHRYRDLTNAAFSDGIAKQKSADKLKRHAVSRKLYQAVLKAAKIDVETRESTGAYSADSDSVRELVGALKENRNVYGSLTSIPTDETLEKSALPFITSQLRNMGFKTEQVNRRDDRKPLEDVYYDALIKPLEEGARLEPVHPNRKRTKYQMSFSGTDSTPDTKRVNHLLKNGVLERNADNQITLNRAELERGFVKASQYNSADRTRTYRAYLDLDTYPNLSRRLEDREAVVRAHVERWLADQRNAEAEALRRPQANFIYTKRRVVGDDVTNVPDALNQARGTSSSTLYSGEIKRHDPVENDASIPFEIRNALNQLDHIAQTGSLQSAAAIHYRSILAKHNLEGAGLLRIAALRGDFDEADNADTLKEYARLALTDPLALTDLTAYASHEAVREHLSAAIGVRL